MAKLSSEAQEVWAKARQDDDYAAFRPYLDRTLELKRRYVACFEPYDDPYDPLLDDYEPGMRTPEVREIFEALKEALVPLIAEVGSNHERRLHARPVPGGRAARVVARDHRALRLHAGALPARHDGPPVRLRVRHAGHPPDDAATQGPT